MLAAVIRRSRVWSRGHCRGVMTSRYGQCSCRGSVGQCVRRRRGGTRGGGGLRSPDIVSAAQARLASTITGNTGAAEGCVVTADVIGGRVAHLDVTAVKGFSVVDAERITVT